MIPASYFYKDAYVRNWGEPTSPCQTQIDGSLGMAQGNGRGGLLGALLAAVFPREKPARRRVGGVEPRRADGRFSRAGQP